MKNTKCKDDIMVNVEFDGNKAIDIKGDIYLVENEDVVL